MKGRNAIPFLGSLKGDTLVSFVPVLSVRLGAASRMLTGRLVACVTWLDIAW